ncbi:hypothetical protein MD273_08410 [Marinobacter pelagius]|uniref:hypothetical protein n=1 Tax=Marinobacter sp. C7 TaxID=2951363 RepID=UPI001EF0C869|nr:hypothetical protein [Marinobacter sp. C7]MCG7199743.1 hypothetical protein [Marinobacter sp. C7]
MDVTRALRKGSLILGAASLVACGGGGSGNSDGGDTVAALACESPDLPVYTLEMDTQNYAGQTIDISVGSDIGGMLGLYSDLEEGFTLVDNVRGNLVSQSGGKAGSIQCKGGGTATVSYLGSGTDTDEQWSFDQCEVATGAGSVRLSGSYRYVDRQTAQTNTSQTREGFEDYNITGVAIGSGADSSDEALVIKGRSGFVFEYEFDSEDGCVTEAISGLEYKRGQRYVALSAAETRLDRAGSSTRIGIQGKLVGSSINGYVNIGTPTSILFEDSQTCPVEGIISVSSNGEAQVRFGSSAGGTAPATGVAVWVNGQSESFDNCQDIGVAPLY